MFSFAVFPDMHRNFSSDYKCFSVSMLSDRVDVERGGKIIMPPSALEMLTRLNINYPMLFKVTNKRISRSTHCGVLEFVADEGKVYIPYWMMRNLCLDEGDSINIESVALPVAVYSRFQPQTVDFLDITNPKAVLENCLRSFACLTTGDVVAINYNDRIYELSVCETRPGGAVTIIECDMTVEFDPPVGYTEPKRVTAKPQDMAVDEEFEYEQTGFVPFGGTGTRLDGKKRKESTSEDKPIRNNQYQRGIPDHNYEMGTLKFFRNIRPASNKENQNTEDDFKPFTGSASTLRSKNN